MQTFITDFYINLCVLLTQPIMDRGLVGVPVSDLVLLLPCRGPW